MQLPKIYYGSLINPDSLTALSVHPRACLAVNVNGVIDWIEEDVEPSSLQDLLASKGLFDVDVIELKNGEFLLPGFVDTHTVGPYRHGGQRLFTDTLRSQHAPQFPNIGRSAQIFNRFTLFSLNFHKWSTV